MSDNTIYTPTRRFDNTNLAYDNHWQITFEALPDIAFFAQRATIPSLSCQPPTQPTPFVNIPQVGDKLRFGTLDVTFAIDAAFKTYFSLFYWLKGYGFPTSYDDIVQFHANRKAQLGNPRALPRQMDTTIATLTLVQTDTDATVAEFRFDDVFPSDIGPLSFVTTQGEPSPLTCVVSFHYTNFDVVPFT
jgi:hypothetical protein